MEEKVQVFKAAVKECAAKSKALAQAKRVAKDARTTLEKSEYEAKMVRFGWERPAAKHEGRLTLLAYAFVRGIPYRVVERKSERPPEGLAWSLVRKVWGLPVGKAASPADTQAILDWLKVPAQEVLSAEYCEILQKLRGLSYEREPDQVESLTERAGALYDQMTARTKRDIEHTISDKLYAVVRSDLSMGQQAVQAAHALCGFSQQYRKVFSRWHRTGNTLVLLSIASEVELTDLLDQAKKAGVLTHAFSEPDLNGEMTAIVIDSPGHYLCRGLPLALSVPKPQEGLLTRVVESLTPHQRAGTIEPESFI